MDGLPPSLRPPQWPTVSGRFPRSTEVIDPGRVLVKSTGRNLTEIGLGPLLAAGFASADCYPTVRAFGTSDGVREHVRIFRDQLQSFAPTITAAGLADAATVEAIGAELLTWGERSDATAAFLVFRSIGWVDPPNQE